MSGGRAPGAAVVRDPGLQPERTRLAWRRTTLACTVAVVLAAKQGLMHDAGALTEPAAAGLSVVAWLVFLAVAHRRMRMLSTARPRPMGARTARAAAGCALALAVFGAFSLL
ncbi:DUF202 domain-containing protein [Streptomyces sp. NPDC060194]|uniref:DUF202 domain-containing protein n=1 Tax=Streptomyces sp. NPDC060194 TaxID=3347069 RepID=UPI0036597B92